MSKKPKLLLSIINWNNNSATNACLASISKLDKDRQPDIHLIDNASKREPLELDSSIKKSLRHLKVIYNDNNLGFGSAHNVSLKFALDNNYDFIVLLNNDTELMNQDLFETLTTALELQNNALAAAPTILSSKEGLVWYAGGDIHKLTSTTSHRGAGNQYSWSDNIEGVSFITGCCVAIDVKRLRQFGKLLADEFFMYWEDADWCSQASKRGFRLLYVPNAVLLHKVSSSLGIRSSNYAYYIIRNNILFIKRNTPIIFKPLSYLFVIITAAKYELTSLRGGWKNLVNIEKALLAGWRDGILKRTGERKLV